MLQQILKDMYIDPDVLEALNEDQKKTLFLKMRQEQVRRWQEREDKLEREGEDTVRRTKPKKANSKSVSWLLGRDGDVAVIVIGEVDELTAKFICSGLGEKKSSSQNSTQHNQSTLANRKTVEPNRTETDTTPSVTSGLQLNKAKCEDASTLAPLSVSVSEHSSPSAAGKQPESKAIGKPEERPAQHTSLCPRPLVRTGAIVVRPATATAAPGCLSSNPGSAGAKLTAAAPTLCPASTTKPEPANAPKAHSPENHRVTQETPGCKDAAPSRVTVRSASEDAFSSGNGTPPCAGRGRVAQLMKAFTTESSAGPPQSPTRGTRPPLPNKPSHLRSTATPSVR
uniref:Zgc:100829 n=1 Tax=Neogobius melanostomus TaxID=47308 RepID=A0A8C6S496_9GOBI